jgi:hypothetical protein
MDRITLSRAETNQQVNIMPGLLKLVLSLILSDIIFSKIK